MFTRVQFDDKSEGVYASKQVTQIDESKCIVKHRGSKYEARVIAMNDDKEQLNTTNLSINLEDFSFGPDFVDINTSNSLLENTFSSDISLIEAEISPTVQKQQENAEPQKKCILQDLQPVQGQNCSDIDYEDNSDDDPNYKPDETPENSKNEMEVSDTTDNLEDVPSGAANASNESSFLTSVSSTYACDDAHLTVSESRERMGDKKANFCPYCNKLQQKISRHLETIHKNEEEVRKFMMLPKGNSERKKMIGFIRKKGNFLYNTDKDINKGDLIVTRRCQKNSGKTGKDYRACANCKGFFSSNSLRSHFAKCSGKSSNIKRVVTLLCKKVTGRIHSRASIVVKNTLFPTLQEDDITRVVRYDELVIIYANKMCEKYKDPRHYDMIRSRIRLLGRFLFAIRNLNKEVSDLTSVFDPKFSDDTVRAINETAKFNTETWSYETPTVAFNLGTLIKQVGNLLITECIKQHNDVRKKNCKDYLKVFSQDVNISVNRTVAESNLTLRRRKTVNLPPMEDIKKLHSYLLTKRSEALKELQNKYSSNAWTDLACLTLLSIQVFNRRRPGETERILIEDFKTYKAINDEDLLKSLSDSNKKLASKYVRFCIRGKLNRTVPVLLDNSMLECIIILLKYRNLAGVPKSNPYVFGIRGKNKPDFVYLRACALMRKFSEKCGARFPDRLRATALRKHIATTCITLNLQEQEVSDVANFMGHHRNIHKTIYRQPVESREILFMSKILEKVQGDDGGKDNGKQDESEGESEEEYDINKEEITSSKSHSLKPRIRSTSPYGHVRKVRWSSAAKNVIYTNFSENLKRRTLPSLATIQGVIRDNPELQNRTSPQVKTWINNQFKA